MNSARELSSRLLDLLRREQAAMADFLVALSDFDRERRWVELGYTSLFYFLHRELKLSAGAAYHRKTAAELIRRFPEVVEPLRDGRLCLSSVCELAKVITPENRAEVLPRFFHASKQEAKAVAAEISPRDAAPSRTVVTSLAAGCAPARAAAPAVALGDLLSARSSAAQTAASELEPGQSFHPGETTSGPPTPEFARSDSTSPETASVLEPGQSFHPGETTSVVRRPASPSPASPSILASMPPRSSAEPLTAELCRLHLTVSKRFLEKLAAAGDALSHSHRGADEAAVLEAGLDLIVERAAKRRGIVASPRAASPSGAAKQAGGNPRAIPAAVRREVWVRDAGRCQWPTSDGGVCGSTRRVQYDHVEPVALGGASTVGNLRLLCCVHNDQAARMVFGDERMDRFVRTARPAPTHHAAAQ